MFQHVLSSNAGAIQEFFSPFYQSIRGVKISIGFYEIQCKYIKEHVDNVGLVILLAIFLPVSKQTKWWNKWLPLGSRELEIDALSRKKKNFKMFVWRPKSDLCWILLLTSNRVPLKASCLPNRLLACTQTLYYFSYRSFQKHRGARKRRTSAEREKEK